MHHRLLQAPSLPESSLLAKKSSLPLATTWSRRQKKRRRTLRAEKLLLDPIHYCPRNKPSSETDEVDICQEDSGETDQEGELPEEGDSGSEEESDSPEGNAGQVSKQDLPTGSVAMAPEEKRSVVEEDVVGAVSTVVAGEKKCQPSVYIPVERSPDVQVCIGGRLYSCVCVCVCVHCKACSRGGQT